MVEAAKVGLFIVIAVAIPLVSAWSAGQFVGQRRPHLFAQWAVLWLVGLGLLYGVFHGVRLEDFGSAMGLVGTGWIAGSVLSAIVALQEFQAHTAQGPASDKHTP